MLFRSRAMITEKKREEAEERASLEGRGLGGGIAPKHFGLSRYALSLLTMSILSSPTRCSSQKVANASFDLDLELELELPPSRLAVATSRNALKAAPCPLGRYDAFRSPSTESASSLVTRLLDREDSGSEPDAPKGWTEGSDDCRPA